MKRILLCLCVAFLLWGCADKTRQAPVQATQEQTEATGAYMADHPVQTETGGALRVYDVTGTAMAAVPRGIAVWNEKGDLQVYDPREGKILYTAAAMPHILAVADNYVYYYKDEICRYDYEAGKTKRWSLPEDIQGDFVLGTKTREIYYCRAGEICGLSMETGISRLIKSHNAQEQALTVYLGGVVLGWKTENGMAYLSSADGTLLSSEQGIESLVTGEDAYLALRKDGMVSQLIAGRTDTEPVLVDLQPQGLIPVFAMNGLVQVTDTMTLRYYDLASGKQTAQITIPNETDYVSIVADQSYVWILTEDTLYRWETALSPVTDETRHTKPLPTAENPDPQGMAECEARIKELEQFHGITILVGKDALKETGGHVLTPEYQTPAISHMLETLSAVLEPFPEGFLGSSLASGKVYICLVRTLDGGAGYDRYWSEGNCYIPVSLEADMTEAVLTGVGGIIDSHILGHSRDLEYWNQMNPTGFAYLNDQPVPEAYAQYVGSYFVDQRAMSRPNEDRAWLFYYAMTENNTTLFTANALQQKLKTLCDGIREAYDLKDYTEPLLWEQYLP